MQTIRVRGRRGARVASSLALLIGALAAPADARAAYCVEPMWDSYGAAFGLDSSITIERLRVEVDLSEVRRSEAPSKPTCGRALVTLRYEVRLDGPARTISWSAPREDTIHVEHDAQSSSYILWDGRPVGLSTEQEGELPASWDDARASMFGRLAATSPKYSTMRGASRARTRGRLFAQVDAAPGAHTIEIRYEATTYDNLTGRDDGARSFFDPLFGFGRFAQTYSVPLSLAHVDDAERTGPIEIEVRAPESWERVVLLEGSGAPRAARASFEASERVGAVIVAARPHPSWGLGSLAALIGALALAALSWSSALAVGASWIMRRRALRGTRRAKAYAVATPLLVATCAACALVGHVAAYMFFEVFAGFDHLHYWYGNPPYIAATCGGALLFFVGARAAAKRRGRQLRGALGVGCDLGIVAGIAGILILVTSAALFTLSIGVDMALPSLRSSGISSVWVLAAAAGCALSATGFGGAALLSTLAVGQETAREALRRRSPTEAPQAGDLTEAGGAQRGGVTDMGDAQRGGVTDAREQDS